MQYCTSCKLAFYRQYITCSISETFYRIFFSLWFCPDSGDLQIYIWPGGEGGGCHQCVRWRPWGNRRGVLTLAVCLSTHLLTPSPPWHPAPNPQSPPSPSRSPPGAPQVWSPGPSCFFGPPTFVEKAGAAREDDGWLLTVMHNAGGVSAAVQRVRS